MVAPTASAAVWRWRLDWWRLKRGFATAFQRLRESGSPDARIRRSFRKVEERLEIILREIDYFPIEVKKDIAHDAGRIAAVLEAIGLVRERWTGKEIISVATRKVLTRVHGQFRELYAYSIEYRKLYCPELPATPTREEFFMRRWVLPVYAKIWIAYLFAVIFGALYIGYPVLRDASVSLHSPGQLAALFVAAAGLFIAVYTLINLDAWKIEME